LIAGLVPLPFSVGRLFVVLQLRQGLQTPPFTHAIEHNPDSNFYQLILGYYNLL
jgi:hypothetical protein